jgi:calmodulin-regulated spectrin-associated protein
MARKKESIMIQSLKRRAEQEAKRLKKEQDLAHKREEERLRRENSEKKKEEERIKRQFILEQYRQRKAAEEAEKNGSIGNSNTYSSRDSNRNNNTLVLNRPSRQRLFSSSKPRPKSLHVSASNIQDYSSLDCKPSRIMDDTDSCQNMLSSNSANSRPQSAMSAQSQNSAFSLSTARRLPSPTQSHSSNVPSFPSGFMLSKFRGPPSDGASDAGSTFSEYTGPKLFVKPSQKSNKVLILNAINVVLAGAVNSDTKKKVLEV